MAEAAFQPTDFRFSPVGTAVANSSRPAIPRAPPHFGGDHDGSRRFTLCTSRIVVVDDDDHVREVTEMVLAGAGYSVRATASGREALRWLEEEPSDLVILDLRMPEVDGPTLYREVLARWPQAAAHVLFMSGMAELLEADHAVRSLDVPILLKPFTLEELGAAVTRALGTDEADGALRLARSRPVPRCGL